MNLRLPWCYVDASDVAGNTTVTASTYTVVFDDEAPLIAASPDRPPNASGWYDGPVTFVFTCGDQSGVASCPAPVTLGGEGSNQFFTVSAVDNAGNVGELVVSGINIDRTGPTLDVSAPVVVQPADVLTIGCFASDALSGVATAACATTSFPGMSLAPGENLFTFSATDVAGNTSSATAVVFLAVDALTIKDLLESFLGTTPGANGLINSLVVKLESGNVVAYISELTAKCCLPSSGKRFTVALHHILVAHAVLFDS